MKKRTKEEGIEKGNLGAVDNRGCVGQLSCITDRFFFILLWSSDMSG